MNWVSNTDRHHKNWAVLDATYPARRTYLAPSFDHGSAVSPYLTDQEREIRLKTGDKGRSVAHYVSRASSRFWLPDGSRPLTLLEAWQAWRQTNPTDGWLRCLEEVTDQEIDDIASRIPDVAGTSTTREFVAAMFKCNRERILREQC